MLPQINFKGSVDIFLDLASITCPKIGDTYTVKSLDNDLYIYMENENGDVGWTYAPKQFEDMFDKPEDCKKCVYHNTSKYDRPCCKCRRVNDYFIPMIEKTEEET